MKKKLITKTLRFNEDIMNALLRLASFDKRSLNNYIELLLENLLIEKGEIKRQPQKAKAKPQSKQ